MKHFNNTSPLVIIALICYSCAFSQTTPDKMSVKGDPGGKTKIHIKSNVFAHEGMIPSKYTCDGENVSPPFSWGHTPEGTKSIAIINNDTDAPMGTWVHWVIYNIPPDITGLPENVPAKKALENGAIQGINDFKSIGYGGPCPPSGTHRYYFKIYALDKVLELKAGATTKELLEAMEKHIIGEGAFMGKYSGDK
ncbi:MAG: YbhB/YbcL family Raf kinase inhibitor-like protein [Bacteroidota bacterium]